MVNEQHLDMLGRAPTRVRSAAGIQLELRRLFQIAPPNVALRQSLHHVGLHFGAVYASLHGYLADTPLSEEWRAPDFSVGDALRERMTEAMFEVLGGANARCLRLQVRGGGASVLIAPMVDQELTVTGAASVLIPDMERDRAIAALGEFEALIGFVSLLGSTENELKLRMETSASETLNPSQIAAAAAANASADAEEDPWRLGWDLVAHVQQRHQLDHVALGILTHGRNNSNQIEVKVVSGLSSVRAGNPGIDKIRSAMEEALDRNQATLYAGRFRAEQDDADGDGHADDPRLHRQWSESSRGDPVATVILRVGDQPVAIVALRHSKVDKLRLASLSAIEAELQPWGSLLPLVERASRGVFRHAIDALEHRTHRFGSKRGPLQRTLIGLGIIAAIGTTLALVPVDDVMHARATLQPAVPHVVSAPQSGRLAELLVHPGDHVEAGDVLARLELRDTELQVQELTARCATLAIDVDVARAEGQPSSVQTTQARLDAAQAELALVASRLESATLRARNSGTILDVDLEPRLGDHITLGEAMFTISENDRIRAEILVPDAELSNNDTLEGAQAVFLPYADPGLEIALGDCVISPVAEVSPDQSAIYKVRAEAFPGENVTLRPGMEGSVRIHKGSISIWTSWTRPIQRWLRRQLWL